MITANYMIADFQIRKDYKGDYDEGCYIGLEPIDDPELISSGSHCVMVSESNPQAHYVFATSWIRNQ